MGHFDASKSGHVLQRTAGSTVPNREHHAAGEYGMLVTRAMCLTLAGLVLMTLLLVHV